MNEALNQKHTFIELLPVQERMRVNPIARFDSFLANHDGVVLAEVRRDLRSLQRSMKREYSWRHGVHVISGQEETERIFSVESGRFPMSTDFVGLFHEDDHRLDSLMRDMGLTSWLRDVLEAETVMERINDPERHRRVKLPTSFPGISVIVIKANRPGWRYMHASFDREPIIAGILSPPLPQLSDWYRDREIYIEEVLYSYYNAIDNGDLEGALAVFVQSGDVRYVRGEEELVGLPRIEEFYKKRRTLFIGKHDFAPFVIRGDEAWVRGNFTGIQIDRKLANFQFTDHFVFSGPSAIRRESSFPDSLQH